MQIEVVWRQYKAALKAFLHSRIDDSDDVDELLQQILIKTHQNLNTIESPGAIKSWLFQVANRSIIDFYRDKTKAQSISSDNLWYEADEESIFAQLAHCVEPFIQALPAKHGQLLQAIEIEGTSQKEYAQTYGIKYSTLKSRVQVARTKLLQLFTNCCEFKLDKQGNLLDLEAREQNCKTNC